MFEFGTSNNLFVIVLSTYILLEMKQFAQPNRFRYLLRTERYKEQRDIIKRQFPNCKCLRLDQAIHFLRLQGYHLDEKDVVKLVQKLYGAKDWGLEIDEVIGLVARVGVDEEIERDMRKIFDFFSGGEDYISTQLGECPKEREINQIMTQMDLNSNGFVNFQTFLEAMLQD